MLTESWGRAFAPGENVTLVRAMTLKAVVRQNRPDVAIKTQRFLGFRPRNGTALVTSTGAANDVVIIHSDVFKSMSIGKRLMAMVASAGTRLI